MKDNIRILSTRPLDDALIEKAAFNNITIDTLSFINVKKLVSPSVANAINALATIKATVVFTSMNAVEVVVDSLPIDAVMPDWKIYCIGGATFTLVKKFWAYESILYTAKNAEDLANQIITNGAKSVIFFCGNKRREELPNILRENNVTVQEIIVYETLETPVKIENKYHAILFFSPSTVTSFFSDNLPSDKTFLFAIGNTTANAIRSFSNNTIVVSDFPAKDQLVDKAIAYFKSETPGMRQD